MKRQIWLMPHQVELVTETLKFMRRCLVEEKSLDSRAAYFAKLYTAHRIDEVLAIFEGKTNDPHTR